MFDFLNAIKKVQEPEHSLKARLHKYLAGFQAARPLSRLHASEVTKPDFCPRRTAIMISVGAPLPEEWISTSLAATFELGHRMQDAVATWAADAGLVVGHWQCLRCSHRHEFCKRPLVCEKCPGSNFRAIEVRIQADESEISGGIDLLVNLGKPKLTVIEIKTMEAEQFKKLVAPLAEHKLRTALYLDIIAKSSNPFASHIDTKEALILYISKGGWGCADPGLEQMGIKEKSSPFKEYVVNRDEASVAPLITRAMELTNWRRNEGPFPGRICDSETCAVAVSCPVRTYCFGKMFPVPE